MEQVTSCFIFREKMRSQREREKGEEAERVDQLMSGELKSPIIKALEPSATTDSIDTDHSC